MSNPVTLLASRRHTLRSEAIGETFQIDVALPNAWTASSAGPLPVIYVMDANTVFGIAAQAFRFLQNADGLPPALLVGVGYELEGPSRRRGDYGGLRTRDLTPTFDADFHEQVAGRAASGVGPAGGADRFLDFLVEELRPFIAGLYEIDPHDQTLVGSSLGGLFCLHALFTRPGAFQRYVANSPSLWWDERRTFAQEAAFAAAGGDLSGRLFLSVGGEETAEPWAMVRDLERLADTLVGRGYPGLSLTRHVFEGETHTSVIPAALSRGLRTVFA